MEQCTSGMCEKRLTFMMKEIESALFEAQEANRAKNNFLSRMSHEMLTPMNVIMGMTQIVKKENASGDLNEYLDQIDNASRNLLRLIHDLLEISGKKDGVFTLADSAFSFGAMFKDVLKEISRSVVEKQQTFNYDIDSSIPELLIGDEKRLAQVMTYLLSNAIKFTPEYGEIHLLTCVHSTDNETVGLRIEIKDSGIGISEEQQEHIFDVFEQVDGSLTRKYYGTGMGLPIARRIIEMLGGKIWVESRLGKETKFTFTCMLKKES